MIDKRYENLLYMAEHAGATGPITRRRLHLQNSALKEASSSLVAVEGPMGQKVVTNHHLATIDPSERCLKFVRLTHSVYRRAKGPE